MPRSQKESRKKKATILLIEDEEILIHLYTTAFARAGYYVHVASTIQDALQIVERVVPDIIFLDLLLPEKIAGSLEFSKRAGYTFLRKIRKDRRLKDAPVIVFTNLDSAEDRKTAKRLKAKEFIVKANFVPKEILKIVEKYVG